MGSRCPADGILIALTKDGDLVVVVVLRAARRGCDASRSVVAVSRRVEVELVAGRSGGVDPRRRGPQARGNRG